MPRYTVVLHGKGDNDKDAYFTNQNEIVNSRQGQGTWTDFAEAQKAAVRARLQDPLDRKVTVVD